MKILNRLPYNCKFMSGVHVNDFQHYCGMSLFHKNIAVTTIALNANLHYTI